MAFKFNWPSFNKEFLEQARQLLNTALNKGNKPANIVDHIVVKELNMGTQAPDLEILEIGELALDKFRGIFKLTYVGDAYLVLQTKVQANPMNNNNSDASAYTRRGILAADQPLIVPMLLRLSNLKLRGIVVLVVSKQKGITLVFKNDPLEKVDVTSTFDGVSSVQRFLQTEIEKRLRIMFQEDLPSIVHQLSLQKFLGDDKKNKQDLSHKGISEQGPMFDRTPLQNLEEHAPYDTISMPELRYSSLVIPNSESTSNTSPESSFYGDDAYDIDSLDGFSAYSTYSNFGDLFDKNKGGLKVIAEQLKEGQVLEGNQPRILHRQGIKSSGKLQRRGSLPTWLPSIHDQQQQIQTPLRRHVYMVPDMKKQSPTLSTGNFYESGISSSITSPDPLDSLTMKMTAANLQRHNQYQYNGSETSINQSYSLSPSTEGPTTPPPYDISQKAKFNFPKFSNNYNGDFDRNKSNNDCLYPTCQIEEELYNHSSTNNHDLYKDLHRPKAYVMQPSETSVAAQLASLMNSNHTISPYTRTLQHLTFRSYPHPINKKPGNKRAKSGEKVMVKRNVLKLPDLTTDFEHCDNY
ncbi:hypothetical protein G9A89_016220 [Geosiphon pyriformis]|nr:hypothetical protein G9A89_016220 [Geosiphon pyriformis]